MTDGDLVEQVTQRAGRAGIELPADRASRLGAYIGLLTKWNRLVNLTALPLEPPTDRTIDRLVVEPLVAAGHAQPTDRVVFDIGSGGGSPAIPMQIALPAVRFVLVESRLKKAAFLREAARELALADLKVEASRLDAVVQGEGVKRAADLVTIRGVRADGALWRDVELLLRPSGRVLWFTTAVASDAAAQAGVGETGLVRLGRHPLVPGDDGRLVILGAGR